MSEPPKTEPRRDTLRDLASRHIWEIQPVRDLLVILAVFLFFWLGAKLSVVTVPLLLAMLIAYLVEPIVQKVTKASWVSRQGAAAGIIVAVVVVVIMPAAIGGAFAARQGVATVSRLTENIVILDDVVSKGAEKEELDRLPGQFWQGLATRLVQIRDTAQTVRERRERGVDPLPDSEPQDREGGATGVPADPDGDTEADAPVETFVPIVPPAEASLIYGLYEQVNEWVTNNRGLIAERLSSSGFDLLRWIAATIISLFSLGFMAFLTAFFFFFICTGWGRVRAFWFSLIPERRQGRAVDLLGQRDSVIAGFVRGRLTIMIIQCAIFSVGYLLIGTPAAIILGVAVGVLSIVPYLAMIGIPISIVLMLLAVDPAAADSFRAQWWWIVFAPIGVYVLGQAADDYVLTPMIQGKSTGLDTPTVLFASLAGGVLGGFYGLLVAIPVAACIKILVREIVWPKFRDWAEGRAADPLPISTGDAGE
ncbi:MAG: AI-2E family transporter [Phycisphaerales bacterium JB050]